MEKQEEMKNKVGYKVVLFPQPYIGHKTPMLHLGNALHSKGFSITVIQTRSNSTSPTEFPNFTFHHIDDAMSNPEAPSLDTVESIFYLNTSCLEPFKKCLSQIIEDASKEKEPVACLIADPMWQFVGPVAVGFGLPRLALRTGGLLAFILYDSLPLLQQKGYFSLQDQTKQDDPVLEVPPLKVRDLPTEEHHHLMAAIVKETKNYPHGFICNTFKELEGSILDRAQHNLLPIPVFPIGPLHKYSPITSPAAQDHNSIAWLNTQAPKSVLYVSFGTLASITNEQFLEVAWGLANSKQPFLWAVRPKLVHGSEKNDQFPEKILEVVSGRSHITTWAPQREVLAHPAVGGFWTHCGWNSTIESICEGVPMICLPFFGDQKMNARPISDVLGIGLQLEKGLGRQEIESAIRRLMAEKEGEEMRQRVAALKEKANLCLVEGGSSYESLDQLTHHILSICPTETMRS